MSTEIYRSVLSAAQSRLMAAITQIRESVPHSGEIGSLVEQVFFEHLLQVLPEKVAISNGFVMDSEGNISKQMDLIFFDRLNTPRIFSSAGAQIFPVESTYACGEIKTKLDSAQINDIFEKCISYKNLKRDAYYSTSNAIIERSYNLFGKSYKHWQSIFFCIAVESVDARVLKKSFDEIVTRESLDIDGRVDTIIALPVPDHPEKPNALLNCKLNSSDGSIVDKSIDFLPCMHSSVQAFPVKDAWRLFVMLFIRYMTQVPTEPVNMLRYGGADPY